MSKACIKCGSEENIACGLYEKDAYDYRGCSDCFKTEREFIQGLIAVGAKISNVGYFLLKGMVERCEREAA